MNYQLANPKIVEVPQAQAIQQFAEVPRVQVQEVVRRVPMLTTEEHVRHLPRVRVQQVEKIVEVPPHLADN